VCDSNPSRAAQPSNMARSQDRGDWTKCDKAVLLSLNVMYANNAPTIWQERLA